MSGDFGDSQDVCQIIKGMLEHNGTEPDLVEEGEIFILRLWKGVKYGKPGTVKRKK